MNAPTRLRFLGISVALLLSALHAHARPVHLIDMQEAEATADTIVIGETAKITTVGPVPESHTAWKGHILAMDLEVKVLHAFPMKDGVAAPGDGDTIHLEYEAIDASRTGVIVNGPFFPHFEEGVIMAFPLRDVSEVTDMKVLARSTDRSHRPGPRPPWALLAEEGDILAVPACAAAAKLGKQEGLLEAILVKAMCAGAPPEADRTVQFALRHYPWDQDPAQTLRDRILAEEGLTAERAVLLGTAAYLQYLERRNRPRRYLSLFDQDPDTFAAYPPDQQPPLRWAQWFMLLTQPGLDRQLLLLPAIERLGPLHPEAAGIVLGEELAGLPGAGPLLRKLATTGGATSLGVGAGVARGPYPEAARETTSQALAFLESTLRKAPDEDRVRAIRQELENACAIVLRAGQPDDIAQVARLLDKSRKQAPALYEHMVQSCFDRDSWRLRALPVAEAVLKDTRPRPQTLGWLKMRYCDYAVLQISAVTSQDFGLSTWDADGAVKRARAWLKDHPAG